MGPIMKKCIYTIRKSVFPGEVLRLSLKPAVSVKLRTQEQTLIPLTMLFMPGQPELTFLTSPSRFHFTLPPRPGSLADLGTDRETQFAVFTHVMLYPHRLRSISVSSTATQRLNSAFFCLSLSTAHSKRQTDPLQRN